MANEAVLMRELELPVSFTCDDSTGIEKGAILKLTDPNTCALSAATNDEIAGIASQEKIASNGQTKIAVYTRGDFKLVASGSITVGDPVGSAATTGSNTVKTLVGVANLSGNCVLGIAKETATTGQTLRVELKPQALTTA